MDGAAGLIRRSPRARRAVRAAARVLNPLVLVVAGRRWMPVLGVIRHRGRRTGRTYVTPLGMRPLAGGLVVPRTFGPDAGWFRNLVAAGSAQATYRGSTWCVDRPQTCDLEAVAAAFPRYERALFRVLGVNDFVLLRCSV